MEVPNPGRGAMLAAMNARDAWGSSPLRRLFRLVGTAALLFCWGSGGQTLAKPAQGKKPPSSQGQKPPNPMIEAIEKLYEKSSFEEALVVLDMANRAPENDDRDRERLAILEGLLHGELLKEDAARKAFARALDLNPRATLPDYAPPKTVKLFEDMRRAKEALIRPQKPLQPPQVPPGSPGPDGRPKVVDLNQREEPWLLANRPLAWVPMGVGGAAATGGIVLIAMAHGVSGTLRAGDPAIHSSDELDLALYRGRSFQTTGWALVGVGGALVAGGLAWHFAPEIDGMLVGVAPAPGGMVATLSGSLP